MMSKIKIRFEEEYNVKDDNARFLCYISESFKSLWSDIFCHNHSIWIYLCRTYSEDIPREWVDDFRREFYTYFSTHHDDCDMIDADDLYDMIEKFFINSVDVHYYMTHVHLGKVTNEA